MAKNELWGYFPGSPVAKTVYSQCRGPGLIPGQGTRGFPCGSAGKESTCNVGDLGLILVLGRSPGEGKGYQLQYSGLESSMDCSLPGSSVHGIFQARMLEWVAIKILHARLQHYAN